MSELKDREISALKEVVKGYERDLSDVDDLSPWISVDELPTESGYFLTRNPEEKTIAGPRMNKYLKGSGWVFAFGLHTEYMPIPD